MTAEAGMKDGGWWKCLREVYKADSAELGDELNVESKLKVMEHVNQVLTAVFVVVSCPPNREKWRNEIEDTIISIWT